ncbi:MAG: hypothetical protein ACHRXM_27035 [Isosphaerales bacterium]
MERLTLTKPNSDPVQIASEALELAPVDIRDDSPSESEPTAASSWPAWLKASRAECTASVAALAVDEAVAAV